MEFFGNVHIERDEDNFYSEIDKLSINIEDSLARFCRQLISLLLPALGRKAI